MILFFRGASGNRHDKLLLWALGVVYLACLGGFAYVVRGADRLPGELGFSLWVQSWRTPWLDAVMTAISALGFRSFALPVVSVTAFLLIVRGRFKEGGLVLGSVVATTPVITIIGHAVARSRPSDDLVHTFRELGGHSFPSGHVTHYVVFLGVLTFVATRNVRSGLCPEKPKGASSR